MKLKTVEYSKTFNLGNYESERVGLQADLEEGDDYKVMFEELKKKVVMLHEEESIEVSQNQVSIESVRECLGEDADLVTVEDAVNILVARPVTYLGTDNWRRINDNIRVLGGEWVKLTAKSGRWEIPNERVS